MGDPGHQEYKIQSLDPETQQLLKTALKEPNSVDLERVANVLVDQSLRDCVFSKEAGRICYTIMQVGEMAGTFPGSGAGQQVGFTGFPGQAENKASGQSVFRRGLLNRLQQEYQGRDQLRARSRHGWVGYVTFICNVFDYLRVDCLVLQLHRIGEQLEAMNGQRMVELWERLRDGFLLEPGLSSMARLQLLELIEFRAAGWRTSPAAQRYYYSESSDGDGVERGTFLT
ncbi:MIF4G domain-containing protein isoform X4 [Tachyglossus aculeatus]|uniref:MIF4G domain-containing protein isoform X4 n=1 Tax=Tachyglossus aculeatus TaxID=9261 RepID=UPI0018F60E6B|nr:MIF4G domain-containing protein isoform X4 [Tachyglossus aculeatus]